MITIKKYPVMLTAILLAAIPVLGGRTAEVTAIRVNSATDKTRIVLQMDEPAQYQTHLSMLDLAPASTGRGSLALGDPRSSISIGLLNTGLGDVRRTTDINDGLVKAVTLSEVRPSTYAGGSQSTNSDMRRDSQSTNSDMRRDSQSTNSDVRRDSQSTKKEMAGSILDVSISLLEYANFTVFPIESPHRIVIDIMPAEPLGVFAAETHRSLSKPEGQRADVRRDSQSTKGELPIFQLSGFSAFAPAQLCFDALLLIILTVMAIKVRRLASPRTRRTRDRLPSFPSRTSRTRGPTRDPTCDAIVKAQNQTFADMMTGARRAIFQQDTTKKGRGTLSGVRRDSQSTNSRVRRDSRSTNSHVRRDSQSTKMAKAQNIQYQKVFELAQQGMDRLAISQQSNVPIGEVDLILGLSAINSQ